MRVFNRLVSGIHALLQSRRVEGELDAELHECLDTSIEENIAAGMTREEATRAARMAMGSIDTVKQQVREVGWESRLEAVGQDLRYAARTLRRSPAFAAVATLTIAIGVGAATSMFSLMQNLLRASPPHVGDPDRVFRLHQAFPGQNGVEETFAGTSYPFFERVMTRASSLENVAAYSSIVELPVGTGADARQTRAVMVSARFWETLGTRPAAGRLFRDEEAHPSTGSRAVVLGHALWQGAYGGRTDVIGRTLNIKGQPYEIVGVTPRGFRGIQLSDVELWLPMFAMEDGSRDPVTWHTAGTSFNLQLVGRLKPGVSGHTAAAELSSLYSAFLLEAYGPKVYADAARQAAFDERNRRARVLLGSIRGGLGGDLRPIPEARLTTWLVLIAFILLGIACANVAGLLLLRAVARRHEIAMRLALGVSRGRLAAQLLTESALLASLGGLMAVLLAMWNAAWFQRAILPAIAWEPVTLMDTRIVGVAAICVFGTALFAGLAPLWYARSEDVLDVRHGSTGGAAKRPRILTGLLAVQCALTVVLLVGAGLFLVSLHNAKTEDLGVDRDNALAVQIDFSGTGRSNADIAAFFERARERSASVPGVTHASLAAIAPLYGARVTGSFRLPGRDNLPEHAGGGPYSNAVTPGFFATTGMRLVQGREFLDHERTQRNAIIVNETMAQHYWPNRSPIGECVFRGRQQACTTVVGVVADSRRTRLIEPERYLYYYTPMPVGGADSRTLLVKKAADAKGVEAAVRQALLDLDANLPFVDVAPMGAALDPQMRTWHLGASVFSAFGTLAIILAAIGLWSSVAFAVSRRTREFAVRLALGAQRRSLISSTVAVGLRDALVAVAAGLVLAAWGAAYVADLLYGVAARDPVIFAAAAVSVLLIAAIASVLPAYRVSAIDPASALRTD